jgi:hypothetical protein
MKHTGVACKVMIHIFNEIQVSQRVFENRALRRIFAPDREEITGDNLYS